MGTMDIESDRARGVLFSAGPGTAHRASIPKNLSSLHKLLDNITSLLLF
jgi:hypothetical protein